MTDLRAILRRFRPLVVPPGLPAAPTIPVDAGADLRSEITTIVRLIDEIEDAAEAREQQARDEVERLLAAADATARSLVSDANNAAAQARADACAVRRQAYDAEIRAEHSRGRREVARIHRVARTQMPGLIEQVVDCAVVSMLPAPRER